MRSSNIHGLWMVMLAGALAVSGCVVSDQEPIEEGEEADEGEPDVAYGAYQGCFEDRGTRALPAFKGSRSDMTPQRCMSMCTGYAYAGVQYYHQCFCGNRLNYSRRSESECNTPCSGDRSQMCGGVWRNSIYAAGSSGGSGGGGSGGSNLGAELLSGESMRPGDFLRSNDGGKLIYQLDGNLVLYSPSGRVRFASGTAGRTLGSTDMQGDGNLVVYDASRRAVWSSGTAGWPGASAYLPEDYGEKTLLYFSLPGSTGDQQVFFPTCGVSC